ncbi:hypothetical protein AVEN_111416-1 [Araneus ventricosus]|uniref:Uncharacterized protein n=1 Tax=Araneus ventricosus TaxID=182803 RepID=A0A4Y2K5Q9_ARAVE|nr:hypothetical protein AVEN_111416-1 [Araneus ventricosus]
MDAFSFQVSSFIFRRVRKGDLAISSLLQMNRKGDLAISSLLQMKRKGDLAISSLLQMNRKGDLAISSLLQMNRFQYLPSISEETIVPASSTFQRTAHIRLKG